MMFEITEARFLAEDIKLFKINAPKIAQKRKAGQFVIIRIEETGERIREIFERNNLNARVMYLKPDNKELSDIKIKIFGNIMDKNSKPPKKPFPGIKPKKKDEAK